MIDWKLYVTVFVSVFLAELGDKTQLATMLFASGAEPKLLTVFLGAASALVVAAAIGVLAGSVLTSLLNPRHLTYAAGIGFIAVGLLTLWRA
jgi:putative Ca2+/H+ antiporter (TMEM165/GDT1 family)